jgi:hypothetical protein
MFLLKIFKLPAEREFKRIENRYQSRHEKSAHNRLLRDREIDFRKETANCDRTSADTFGQIFLQTGLG